MKKALIISLALILTVSLAACRLSNHTNVPSDGTQNSTDYSASGNDSPQTSGKTDKPADSPVGCKSEEKLICSYIDWLNGQISDDAFYSFFDYKGLIALALTEDGIVDSMAVGYQLAVSYLNHDIEDKQVLREINATLVEGNRTDVISEREIAELLRTMLQHYREQASQAVPFEKTNLQENIWRHEHEGEVDYSTYHIFADNLYYNNNPDLPLVSLNMDYYCHDGIWYWIFINETV